MSEQFMGFPAWRYGPDGGASVFASADEVPAGWDVSPSAAKAAAQGSTPAGSLPLTRRQVIAELTNHKAQFETTAPTSVLYEQLVAIVDKET